MKIHIDENFVVWQSMEDEDVVEFFNLYQKTNQQNSTNLTDRNCEFLVDFISKPNSI